MLKLQQKLNAQVWEIAACKAVYVAQHPKNGGPNDFKQLKNL